MNYVITLEEKIKMFESDELEHQRMNSNSHTLTQTWKNNIEWSGNWKYNHIRKLHTEETTAWEYLPWKF